MKLVSHKNVRTNKTIRRGKTSTRGDNVERSGDRRVVKIGTTKLVLAKKSGRSKKSARRESFLFEDNQDLYEDDNLHDEEEESQPRGQREPLEANNVLTQVSLTMWF